MYIKKIYPPIYVWVFEVVSFPQVSQPKPCIHLSSPAIRATCPVQLILLDLLTQTILGEEYISLISSLCSFLYSFVTLYLLVNNNNLLLIYVSGK